MHLRRAPHTTLLEDAIRLFPSVNLANQTKLLQRLCNLRLFFATVDLHPTYQRFRSLAQHNLEQAFFSICNQHFTNLLRVSSQNDSSSDSDFTDSGSAVTSENQLSEQDTEIDEFFSDSSSQQSNPPERDARDDDLAIEFPRSFNSSPLVPPSLSRNRSHRSRNLFPDQRGAPPVRDNARLSLNSDRFSNSRDPLRFSYRTYLIRFIPEPRFRDIFKCFDHLCNDSDHE